MLKYDLDYLAIFLDDKIGELLQDVRDTAPGDDLDYRNDFDPYDRVFEAAELEQSLWNYFPSDLQEVLGRSRRALELHVSAQRYSDVRFCFELALAGLDGELYTEPIFTLLQDRPRRHQDTTPSRPVFFRDHVFHLFHVFCLGSLLTSEASSTDPNECGLDLLAQRIEDNREPRELCVELLYGEGEGSPFYEDPSEWTLEMRNSFRDDLRATLTIAWPVASLCHDLGYYPHLIETIMSTSEWRDMDMGEHRFRGWHSDLCDASNIGRDALQKRAPCRGGRLRYVLNDLLGDAALRTHPIDHGRLSALFLANRFARETARSGLPAGQARAALILAVCAICRHATDEWKDSFHLEEYWCRDPLAAFLCLVDEMQEVARVNWYVGKIEENEALTARVPIEAWVPFPQMDLDFSKKVTYRYVLKRIDEENTYDPAAKINCCWRRRIKQALGSQCLGLIEEQSFCICTRLVE